tara:strand:+ start:87 stop:257 length:171 start_codon:yes stop_codon:yes gene_type:complete
MGVENKKGQSLTLGTIILIVLGVAALVFLIVGLSMGLVIYGIKLIFLVAEKLILII